MPWQSGVLFAAGCVPPTPGSYGTPQWQAELRQEQEEARRALETEGYDLSAQSSPSERTPTGDFVVTAGPVATPNEVLGEVHVDTRGWVSVGALLNDTLFRSPLATSIQATPKATVSEMNQWLKREAVGRYGAAVDAIINVTYSTDPSGDVSADGLAVKFVKPAEAAAAPHAERSAADRLRELDGLRTRGLISKPEYERARARILDGL